MALTAAIDWVKRHWFRGRRWIRPGGGMQLLSRLGILLIFVGLAAGISVWRAAAVRTAALTTWPWVLTHHEEVRNLALVVAGVFAVPLAIWRARVAARQAETARRSLLNERDQKAAEMLGSDLLSVRLGGIYALQILAAEHPPHYHLGVMRQFCAFVREPRTSTVAGATPEPVREDVRAVMDAIAARSDTGIAVEQKEKGFRLDLSGANLREWRFSGANLFEVNLSEADLAGAGLEKVNLATADLATANLAGAKLIRADLTRANLAEANLSGADLSGANLATATLSRATLTKAFLPKANLAWATLPEANLTRVILAGANLTRALLPEANLPGADLSGADLFGADLSGADLSGADLSEADLFGADLSEAMLIGAKLRGCNVSRTRFSAVTVITQEQLDETLAKPPDEPPIFVDDVLDAKTGLALEWRR